MRGGLDDALDKLARRDELRRRAAAEANGTPPAVTELVEAIAAVVARNPQLAVTVGVEGAGDPVLLQFGFADGVVQVNADTTVAARAADQTPRHADFEIDVEDAPAGPAEPPRASHDDQDRFGPADFTYEYEEPPTAERPFVAPVAEPYAPPPSPGHGVPAHSAAADFVPGFAAHHAEPQHSDAPYADQPQFTEQPAFVEPPAPGGRPGPQSGYLPPLATPIPLKVERPEETEMAVRRLAALLRDDPTLLDNPPA